LASEGYDTGIPKHAATRGPLLNPVRHAADGQFQGRPVHGKQVPAAESGGAKRAQSKPTNVISETLAAGNPDRRHQARAPFSMFEALIPAPV